LSCKVFLERLNFFNSPNRVNSQVSEGDFRVFLAAIEGATEVGMDDVINLDSLNREFQFVKFGRRVGESVSQHSHIEVGRLKSVITDL
jgi:hypothetical protein